VEGKANDECIRLLAELLGVKRGQVTIIAGHTSRTKTVAVKGLKADQVASSSRLCEAFVRREVGSFESAQW